MSAPNQSDAPGAQRSQAALIGLFCLLPVVSVGGGLAIAPLLALAGLIALPLRAPRGGVMAILGLATFAAWAGATVLWSPVAGAEQATKLVATFFVGLSLTFASAGLPPQRRALVRACVLASMCVLALLLGAEALFDMPFNRAAQPDAATGLLERNPGRGVLVLEAIGFAALAAALMSRGAIVRWGVGAALVVAMAGLSLCFNMSANAAGFVLGAAAFALGLAAPRIGLALVAGVAAFWVLAAPWIVLATHQAAEAAAQAAPQSWAMRLQIWTYAAKKIEQRPLLGWGFNSSRAFHEQQTIRDYTHDAIPLHPHSFSLQIWLETGAVGAVLVALAIALAARAASKAFAGERAAAAAACGGGATLWLAWNVSYGAWQEWFLALPFMLAAAALALRRGSVAS